jgi:hypothetical protein
MVMACPECGLLVMSTCHHDGEDVRAEEMNEQDARDLRRCEYEYLIDRAEAYKE